MLADKANGFSLIELLIAFCILGIALVVVTPSVIGMINSNKQVALRDELVSALNLTRSTAITTGNWATICRSDAFQKQCKRSGSDWDLGWIIFTDKNRNGLVDNAERIISVQGSQVGDVSIQSDNSRITYDSQGVADGFKASFRICSYAEEDELSAILVSNFGRIREATSEDKISSCYE